MAARGRSEGGGIFGVLGTLFLLGLVVKYIWWIVGAAVVAGLSVAVLYLVRAMERRAEERDDMIRWREEGVALRADQQLRWMLMGDSRGVYGPDGATAMRAVAPLPATEEDEPAPVARLAGTVGELAALAHDRPRAWPHALFASVLLQRSTPLRQRLRDSELGFSPATTLRLSTAFEVGHVLLGLIDEMLATIRQLAQFMNAPAFMAPFGSADGNYDDADAEGIEHTAHRLMDYHDRLLELSERCRAWSAPAAYTPVIADCARLLDAPLQGYRTFIAEFGEIIEALPRVLDHANGTVHLGALALCLDPDDQLLAKTTKRLHEMSGS